MEGNNRQQRERSEERSPETSPMMVPATQPRSSMFSCCLWMASDEPVDVPASNVTQDPIVKPPTRQSHVNNPDTSERIIRLENTELQVLSAGAKRSNNTPLPGQPGHSNTKKDTRGDQDGRNKLNQGSSQNQNQDQKIKFLINVPMWVPLLDNNRTQEQIQLQLVQNLLTLLEGTGFKEEDKEHLEDVAIIIGLNGKDSPELRKQLSMLMNMKEKTVLKFKKISFTWGPKGDIKYEDSINKKKDTPYTDIREYLKDHEETKQLVRELRGQDPDALIYFSCIDADTVSFNQVYSSYLEIVRKHCNTHSGIPPTVMSTGYEFPEGDFKKPSQVDRMTRIQTAKHFPLGTYYPEPNFCVLLLKGEDTLTESFLGKGKTMESPKCIKKVKDRDEFIAVFTADNPIITSVPARCKVNKDGLTTAQSHYNPRVWATSANIHGEIKSKLKGRGSSGKTRGFLMELLTCPDEEFENKCKELPVVKDDAFQKLCEAAAEVREYRKKVREDESRQAESRAKQPEM
ncbi:uncharacterized protein isoform X2 [Salmo salar]|uniref:Uncharacterized protein LOC106587367 isoform X2 n=1 Tax=Salmo salar TaxID=8030 RepID=A0ABM3E137_SALSA|nr:uncharacterized protein LOC106587367 isoform X2 [Salmo salar]XP_045564765.1 uncharacterized protein LOC106587367 isoform X2 [Salmo salar]XP_045564766.1 uncharacterized protein LOC106587367 isoform X2 [Salmo salar]XP_045564767.1 uncharacterized protein LOC106587367 isoform X2 [Salmo salar]XP_045564768.1 uncharacterized protein LOC106587367 isoform X2 [Salmo salar]XP_045564769.1 uncharacterized protein LOC106587367 isoform X2 [Salmo salar]XP_045564770.1 uncharacterized protein LOC106587367 i|eukprot:XP_014031186.1 PREDICTED: uncharacterized protein LOC106587367 isoform X2 [Salmo salar]